MFQQIILGLGYASAILTGVNGILALTPWRSSGFAKLVQAAGVDVQKAWSIFAPKSADPVKDGAL